MADAKISALAAAAVAAGANEIPINEAGTTKKITVAQLLDLISAYSELPATGTIDGSNTDFTFTQKPSYIYLDGVKIKETAGWTWSVSTATTSVPPQFSIWGEK